MSKRKSKSKSKRKGGECITVPCHFCGVEGDPSETLCYGCQHHVCDSCDVHEPFGKHAVEEHRDKAWTLVADCCCEICGRGSDYGICASCRERFKQSEPGDHHIDCPIHWVTTDSGLRCVCAQIKGRHYA